MSTLADALRLYQDGKWEEASRLLRILVEFDRTNPQAWVYYGACLGQLGRWGPAVDAYRQATGLLPEEASAHCDLASALIEVGRLEQADDSVTTALLLEPQHPVALELRRRIEALRPAEHKPLPSPPGTAAPRSAAATPRRVERRLQFLLILLALLLVISAVVVARKPGEKWRLLRQGASLMDQASRERLRLQRASTEDFAGRSQVEQLQDRAGAVIKAARRRGPELPEVYLLQARLTWERDQDGLGAKNDLQTALGLLQQLPAQRRRPLGYSAQQLRALVFQVLCDIELSAAYGANRTVALRRAEAHLHQARAADPGLDVALQQRALETARRLSPGR
ncbi:MAG: hypothetical protein IT204_05835 [Fimbriimonadaceae bacterium]|nr:hypothetical protein [Fimbriimonadaceae bacterium]